MIAMRLGILLAEGLVLDQLLSFLPDICHVWVDGLQERIQPAE